MSTILFLNNYQTTLAAALTSTGTTMSVSSATGLPASLVSGQFIPMTLTPASSPGSAYEIVYVTAISGSNLTVTRGEEGTSALNWNVGDILYSTNTADTTGTLSGSPTVNFQTDTLTASGLITANGGMTVPSGETLAVGGTITVQPATTSNEAIPFSQSLLGTRQVIFTSDGTWTVPDGVTSILISGVGSGGGGASGAYADGSGYSAGGGGGGGAGQPIFMQEQTVSPGDTVTVTIGGVGGGGAGVGVSPNNGANGGAASSSTITNGTWTISLAGGGGGGAGSYSETTIANGGFGGPGYPPGAHGQPGAANSHYSGYNEGFGGGTTLSFPSWTGTTGGNSGAGGPGSDGVTQTIYSPVGSAAGSAGAPGQFIIMW